MISRMLPWAGVHKLKGSTCQTISSKGMRRGLRSKIFAQDHPHHRRLGHLPNTIHPLERLSPSRYQAGQLPNGGYCPACITFIVKSTIYSSKSESESPCITLNDRHFQKSSSIPSEEQPGNRSSLLFVGSVTLDGRRPDLRYAYTLSSS